MLTFSIDKSVLKDFMSKLIKEDAFDVFDVRSVEIQSFARFEITGFLDKDFIAEDERGDADRSYCGWKDIRPHVFNIIKGSKRPKSIKIVLSLPPGEVRQMHPNAAAYFLNIYFEGDVTYCTAAASEKVFSMDKTLAVKWEEYVNAFMKRIGVIIN